MGYYSEELLDLIFSKGSVVRGMNPKLYRKDCYGNLFDTLMESTLT